MDFLKDTGKYQELSYKWKGKVGETIIEGKKDRGAGQEEGVSGRNGGCPELFEGLCLSSFPRADQRCSKVGVLFCFVLVF